MSASLIKNAIISGHPAGAVVMIHESDRNLYIDCEFKDVSIVISEGVDIHTFIGCLFRNCKITSEGDMPVTNRFVGKNILLDCSFNNEDVDDLRTN